MAALAGISPWLTPLQRAKPTWTPWRSLAPLLFNSNVARVVHPLSSVRTTLPSDAFARVSAVLCDASVGMNESPLSLPRAHGEARPPFLPPLTNGAAAVSTALWELFFGDAQLRTVHELPDTTAGSNRKISASNNAKAVSFVRYVLSAECWAPDGVLGFHLERSSRVQALEARVLHLEEHLRRLRENPTIAWPEEILDLQARLAQVHAANVQWQQWAASAEQRAVQERDDAVARAVLDHNNALREAHGQVQQSTQHSAALTAQIQSLNAAVELLQSQARELKTRAFGGIDPSLSYADLVVCSEDAGDGNKVDVSYTHDSGAFAFDLHVSPDEFDQNHVAPLRVQVARFLRVRQWQVELQQQVLTAQTGDCNIPAGNRHLRCVVVGSPVGSKRPTVDNLERRFEDTSAWAARLRDAGIPAWTLCGGQVETRHVPKPLRPESPLWLVRKARERLAPMWAMVEEVCQRQLHLPMQHAIALCCDAATSHEARHVSPRPPSERQPRAGARRDLSAQSWLTAFLQWRSVTDAIPRAVKEAASGENVPGAHVLTTLLQKRVVQQMGPQPLDYAKAALTEGVPFAQATKMANVGTRADHLVSVNQTSLRQHKLNVQAAKQKLAESRQAVPQAPESAAERAVQELHVQQAIQHLQEQTKKQRAAKHLGATAPRMPRKFLAETSSDVKALWESHLAIFQTSPLGAGADLARSIELVFDVMKARPAIIAQGLTDVSGDGILGGTYAKDVQHPLPHDASTADYWKAFFGILDKAQADLNAVVEQTGPTSEATKKMRKELTLARKAQEDLMLHFLFDGLVVSKGVRTFQTTTGAIQLTSAGVEREFLNDKANRTGKQTKKYQRRRQNRITQRVNRLQSTWKNLRNRAPEALAEQFDFFAERLRDHIELLPLFSWVGNDKEAAVKMNFVDVYGPVLRDLLGKSGSEVGGMALHFREGMRQQLEAGDPFHHSMLFIQHGRELFLEKNRVPALVLGLAPVLRADMAALWGLLGQGGLHDQQGSCTDCGWKGTQEAVGSLSSIHHIFWPVEAEKMSWNDLLNSTFMSAADLLQLNDHTSNKAHILRANMRPYGAVEPNIREHRGVRYAEDDEMPDFFSPSAAEERGYAIVQALKTTARRDELMRELRTAQATMTSAQEGGGEEARLQVDTLKQTLEALPPRAEWEVTGWQDRTLGALLGGSEKVVLYAVCPDFLHPQREGGALEQLGMTRSDVVKCMLHCKLRVVGNFLHNVIFKDILGLSCQQTREGVVNKLNTSHGSYVRWYSTPATTKRGTVTQNEMKVNGPSADVALDLLLDTVTTVYTAVDAEQLGKGNHRLADMLELAKLLQRLLPALERGHWEDGGDVAQIQALVPQDCKRMGLLWSLAMRDTETRALYSGNYFHEILTHLSQTYDKWMKRGIPLGLLSMSVLESHHLYVGKRRFWGARMASVAGRNRKVVHSDGTVHWKPPRRRFAAKGPSFHMLVSMVSHSHLRHLCTGCGGVAALCKHWGCGTDETTEEDGCANLVPLEAGPPRRWVHEPVARAALTAHDAARATRFDHSMPKGCLWRVCGDQPPPFALLLSTQTHRFADNTTVPRLQEAIAKALQDQESQMATKVTMVRLAPELGASLGLVGFLSCHSCVEVDGVYYEAAVEAPDIEVREQPPPCFATGFLGSQMWALGEHEDHYAAVDLDVRAWDATNSSEFDQLLVKCEKMWRNLSKVCDVEEEKEEKEAEQDREQDETETREVVDDNSGGLGEVFYEDLGDDIAAHAAQAEWSDELRSDLQMRPDKLGSEVKKWDGGRDVWVERLINMWLALDIQLHEQEENRQDSSDLKKKSKIYLIGQVSNRLKRYQEKGSQ